ncbi:MAG: peptidylprolyl isomerase [Woeseiaceae bacterium]|nr:peptidylprolyl isomerase [Woeseiaceae bacterium]
MLRVASLIVAFVAACSAPNTSLAKDPVPEPPKHPYVEIDTTMGRILLELDGQAAPYTVDHFLTLVDSGYYNNTIFHRVIPDFMIQAGGHTPDLKRKEDDGYVINESGNGLSNLRGTIALARTAKPHTANAQFFINVVDNIRLNAGKGRWGYTVFGFVIEGMDVVDAIAAVRTGPQGTFDKDVPLIPIVIKSMSRYTFE